MSTRKTKTENRLTRECIFTALLMLMEKKEFKDITISEITKKAGVSRMTYYRTYESKEDILIQYFEDKLREMLKSFHSHVELTSYQFCHAFFTFFKDNSHLVTCLYKADLLRLIMNRFSELLEFFYHGLEKEEEICEQTLRYQIFFRAGGLFSMLIHWVEGGQLELPEEMARIAVEFLDKTPFPLGRRKRYQIM